MTILTIVQNVCAETGCNDVPTIVMASGEARIVQLRAIASKVCRHLRGLYLWRELNKEHTFTLVSSQVGYALPGDFDHDLFETHWNRDDGWAIVGPMDAQYWQYAQANTTVSIHQKYRLKGAGLSQFVIDPTPDSSDAGQTCAFEYQTKSCIRPATWATNTAYGAAAKCWYDGKIYVTAAGGVSLGSTGPVNDTGITWTVSTDPYETFLYDTDCPMFNEDLVELGLKAFFQRETRKEGWEEEMQRFYEEARAAAARSNPIAAISFGTDAPAWPNIPETGINNYGN